MFVGHVRKPQLCLTTSTAYDAFMPRIAWNHASMLSAAEQWVGRATIARVQAPRTGDASSFVRPPPPRAPWAEKNAGDEWFTQLS